MTWSFLWILAQLIAVLAAQSLVLVPGDPIQPKTKGSGLIVRCDATGLAPGEDPQLTWTSPTGQVITSENKTDLIYVHGKGTQRLTLRINVVQGEHGGTWVCTGMLGGQTQTRDVFFDVFEDITFEGEQYQRPTIHTDALIKCRVGGSPQPEVSWSNNGVVLNGGRYLQQSVGLQILNISKTDNGEYLCRAEITSRGRYEEYPITVEVTVPPKLTSPPKMTKGIEGKYLTMYCNASGDPKPSYKWYKDQLGIYVKLNNGGRYEISEINGTMKIKQLKGSDDGVYKCVASNLAGLVEGTAEIDVLVPPQIIRQDHGVGVAGGTVIMVCEATGDPAPEMKWLTVGSSLPNSIEGQTVPDPTNSRVTVVQTKEHYNKTRLEMRIASLELSDIGNYTCMAHNEAGNDTGNTPLNVLMKPTLVNLGTNISPIVGGAVGGLMAIIIIIIILAMAFRT